MNSLGLMNPLLSSSSTIKSSSGKSARLDDVSVRIGEKRGEEKRREERRREDERGEEIREKRREGR